MVQAECSNLHLYNFTDSISYLWVDKAIETGVSNLRNVETGNDSLRIFPRRALTNQVSKEIYKLRSFELHP